MMRPYGNGKHHAIAQHLQRTYVPPTVADENRAIEIVWEIWSTLYAAAFGWYMEHPAQRIPSASILFHVKHLTPGSPNARKRTFAAAFSCLLEICEAMPLWNAAVVEWAHDPFLNLIPRDEESRTILETHVQGLVEVFDRVYTG